MVIFPRYFHRESNPDQRFRKPPFYPLNYGSSLGDCRRAMSYDIAKVREIGRNTK